MSVVGDLVGPLRPSYDGPVDNENIYRRNGGCGVVAEDKFYVWGGEGAEQRLLDPDSEEEEDFSVAQVGGIWCVTVLPPPRVTDYPFDVYDMHECTWSRQKTTGDVPLLGLGSSLNHHVQSRTMYLFGGWNYGNFDAEVYRIVLDDWCWFKVEITSTIKPMGRYMTGTLIHEDRLCTLGGAGLDITPDNESNPQDPGARYEQTYFKGAGFGLNNEYWEFDMNTNEWSVPLGKFAQRPDPLNCHCFVKFDSSRAILFGGGYKGEKRNETRIFNLTERKFSEPLKFSEPCPIGRAFTTLTPLIDPCTVRHKQGSGPVPRQMMLLLWGKIDNILTDSWILEVDIDNEDASWIQLDINTYARAWHIAGPLYYPNSNQCRLAIFGGNVHWDGFVGRRRNIGDVRMVQFGVSSLLRLCAGVTAREFGDVSTLMDAIPLHSRANTVINREHATLANATPMLTATRHHTGSASPRVL